MAEQDRTGGAPGFRANADDTPRGSANAPSSAKPARPQPSLPAPDPAQTDLDIDAALPPLDLAGRRPAPSAPRLRPRRFVALAVTIAAFALGIGVGLQWARVRDAVWPQAPTVGQSAAPVPAGRAAPEPAPAAAPAPHAQDQTRPQDSAALARRIEAPRPAPRAAQTSRPAASVPETAQAASATDEAAHDAVATARSASGPSGECEDAGTLAGQLGCDDPAIAQAHREMANAYLRALDSGAPEAQLSADQARWLTTRRRAALTSHEALLHAYRRRTAQLEAWTPGPSDAPD